MTEGIEPTMRPLIAANDSALLTALIALLALNLLLAPTLIRSAKVLFKQLFSSRREPLPGEKTFGERLVVASGIVQTLVFEALLLYCLCGGDETPPLASLAGLSVLTLLLFIYQTAGYLLTGYTFANGEDSHTRLSTLMITEATAGFPIAIAAICALFYPEFSVVFLTIGAALYFASRIPLYIREFRIFYTNPASLFYFFLYLCTLEIAPLIGILAFAGFFSTLFC